MLEDGGFFALSKDQQFELIGQLALLFHEALHIDNTILITDTEIVRTYHMGDESSQSRVQASDLIGKPIPENSNIPSVLKTGVLKRAVIPKEYYGVGFKSSTIAIKDNVDKVIGTITLMLSLKSQEALKEVTDNISSSSEQLSATTQELASSAGFLSGNVIDVLGQTKEILSLIEQTNDILDFVNSVATNSRLLGLNAAIEAARAGEFGRGFAVVADEIRKMAENSAKSVNDTKKLIATINTKVNHLMQKVEELNDVASTQAAASQEMSATIQTFADNAQTMQKLSNVI